VLPVSRCPCTVRDAAAALWDRDTLTSSAARRTNSSRASVAKRQSRVPPPPSLTPLKPPTHQMTDGGVDQSQAAWFERLSAQSQSEGGWEKERGEDREGSSWKFFTIDLSSRSPLYAGIHSINKLLFIFY